MIPKCFLAFAFATILAAPAAGAVFQDDFNRPDGPVGNGWLDSASNAGGDLVLSGGAVAAPNPSGHAAIYRAADLSGDTTATATITDMNGFAGLRDRFAAAFVFGGDTFDHGLAVGFFRGDQNYADSSVRLFLDGAELGVRYSDFQFSQAIRPKVTLEQNGVVQGVIDGGGGAAFHFAFAAAPGGAPSLGRFALYTDFEDDRASTFTPSTFDDLTLTSDPATPIPEPEAWLLMILGFAAAGAAVRRARHPRRA
jgi:hypothetical protein